MNIIYSHDAVRVVNRMDAPTKQRIRIAIERLPAGDIKPLQGVQGHYRLRVGEWRILYFFEDAGTIRIKRIAPR